MDDMFDLFNTSPCYGKNRIQFLCGEVTDALKLLPDKSVHCMLTSPPYFRLRNYQHELQIGMEETPEEFIEKLVNVFREARRVLRDDGTLWINIGDSYAGSGKSGTTDEARRRHRQFAKIEHDARQVGPTRVTGNLKPKDLIGVPWMLAFALRDDGWYLRSDIIWSKNFYTPESVTDRPTKSYEHIFMFSKNRSYFYDQDAIRRPIKDGNSGKVVITRFNSKHLEPDIKYPKTELEYEEVKGANERDVWFISFEPSRDEHYAPFPTEIPRRIIKVSTSECGVCSVCGKPYTRNMGVEKAKRKTIKGSYNDDGVTRTTAGLKGVKHFSKKTMLGWQQSCSCEDSNPIPATIVDPFAGSCTTGIVAAELSRNGIMIDIKDEYVKMGHRRLKKAGYTKILDEIVYIPVVTR